ncbi:Seipin [Neolecta irregularis DAH-3]|uniref:Seipin n=1 Tax=Neolecta irregularis (strain DAH-3) TaxID=1198029 RepID=A0A1U7LTL2_NEOID|nr:Seipin [Neolecta irregularis DAH-3]|eukprot:OLL25923.1 Seipin [Neolecta irregularis DAH-3]
MAWPIAVKAVSGSILYSVGAFSLLAVSCLSYLLFFWNYVPVAGISREVFLIFGQGNPWAEILIDPFGGLFPNQDYELSADLVVPNSPSNIDIGPNALIISDISPLGNFMIKIDLTAASNETLITISKPAIVTYVSPLIHSIRTLVKSPFYISGMSKETERLSITFISDYAFSGGWSTTPKLARIEVESRQLRVYSLKLHIFAKLSGLRWMMYHHRFISAAIFILIFWAVELLFTTAAWIYIWSKIPSPKAKVELPRRLTREEQELINEEPVDLDSSEVDSLRLSPALGSSSRRRRPTTRLSDSSGSDMSRDR